MTGQGTRVYTTNGKNRVLWGEGDTIYGPNFKPHIALRGEAGDGYKAVIMFFDMPSVDLNTTDGVVAMERCEVLYDMLGAALSTAVTAASTGFMLQSNK